MALLRDIEITETLLTAYNIVKCQVTITYQNTGHSFTSKFSLFSVMIGWIAEMLFMLFFAYTTL